MERRATSPTGTQDAFSGINLGFVRLYAICPNSVFRLLVPPAALAQVSE